MKTKLFDSAIVGNAQEAVDFIGNSLESSTGYSVIGKDLDGIRQSKSHCILPGGQINFLSDHGKGSTFTLEIPGP